MSDKASKAFTEALMKLYAKGAKMLGVERCYNLFLRFFAFRALRYLEVKGGAAIEDSDERAAAIEDLQEALRGAVDEIHTMYLEGEESGGI
jgi:hypothetical protein